MKNKWSPGKIAAVICGSIAGGILLLILLFLGIFFSVKNFLQFLTSTNIPEEIRQEAEEEFPWFDGDGSDPWEEEEDSPKADTAPDFREEEEEEEEEDWLQDWIDQWEYENSGDSEYYEFHDAIRSDLSYQINKAEYVGQAQDNSRVTSKIIYPVVEGGEEAKTAAANKAIQAELRDVEDYLNSISDKLDAEDELNFDGVCYVSYMDEGLLSVVYWEEGWLNGSWQEACLISVNIDMESGIPLTNSQILDADEAFAIDFRERSKKQNGEDEYLNMYSDQEITEMLNSEDSLIVFYTPLGLEVGINHYGGWVTVTYQDYEKYLKKF